MARALSGTPEATLVPLVPGPTSAAPFGWLFKEGWATIAVRAGVGKARIERIMATRMDNRAWRKAMARQFKVIVERHTDGYVAYPLGLKGVVVGQGDTYAKPSRRGFSDSLPYRNLRRRRHRDGRSRHRGFRRRGGSVALMPRFPVDAPRSKVIRGARDARIPNRQGTRARCDEPREPRWLTNSLDLAQSHPYQGLDTSDYLHPGGDPTRRVPQRLLQLIIKQKT